MQTKDLMIGDWVVVDNTPLQIAALGTTKAGFADSKNELFYHYYDVLQPIPLTAEILEKNGFNVQKIVSKTFRNGCNLWTYADGECSVYIYENGVIWWLEAGLENYAGKIEMPISDVHELQHALRLFGIKKDINL